MCETIVLEKKGLHVRLGLVGLCPGIHCLSVIRLAEDLKSIPPHIWLQFPSGEIAFQIVIKVDARPSSD